MKTQMTPRFPRHPQEKIEFYPLDGADRIATSRSKFVAEANVGSLLCVDRLGSISDDPAAMSMNESRHSSAARQRYISNSGATSSGGALRQSISSWGRAVCFSDAGIAASQYRSIARKSGSRASALRRGTNVLSSAVSELQAMKSPQGASPARFVSTAGEGPDLCFLRIPFQRLYRS